MLVSGNRMILSSATIATRQSRECRHACQNELAAKMCGVESWTKPGVSLRASSSLAHHLRQPRLGDVCSAQGLLAAPLHAVGDRQRPWPTTDHTAASRATSMCPHEDVDLKTCCLVLAEQRELRDPGKGGDDVHDVDGAGPGRLKKRGSRHLY